MDLNRKVFFPTLGYCMGEEAYRQNILQAVGIREWSVLSPPTTAGYNTTEWEERFLFPKVSPLAGVDIERQGILIQCRSASKTEGGNCYSLGPLNVMQASEVHRIPHRSAPSIQDCACWKKAFGMAVLQSAIPPCGQFGFGVGLAREDGVLESYPMNVVVSVWRDRESTVWGTHQLLLSLQAFAFELFPPAMPMLSRRAIFSDDPGPC